ncbi:MAG: hypothetical protein M3N24_11220 [Actinomycetota bacterium]|nr:hypothetical protein [Actinomycetota bacterium]
MTASDFSFEHPPTVEAGAVELQMTNEGENQHVLIVARVNEGATLGQARRSLLSDDPTQQEGPPPYSFVPGVAEVTPGHSGNSTQILEPGEYIMICPIPDADGIPHFAKGMVSTFEATGTGGGSLPTAEATVTAQEFAFLNVPQLGAGDHVLSMRNAGKQEHEFNLAELAPGKTVQDIVEFMKQPPGQGGAPPMILHGGALMQPGLSATARYTLEPGKQYALVCLVPDFSDTPPTPHVVKGMYTQAFTAT